MNTDLFSHINWLAVLVAGLAYFVLGAIWYSKALFAPKWAKLVGIDMSNPDPNMKKGLASMMLGSFVLIILSCIGLSMLVVRMDLFILSSGLKLGAITGLLFATTAVSISFIYEKRPLALYFIDCGYHVVGHLAAAVILVMWR